ncbi:hypothetical protein OS493_040188, partial [Desmophyllum pertusum]
YENIKAKDDYVLSYNRRLRLANWVSEHLTVWNVYNKDLDRGRCDFEEVVMIEEQSNYLANISACSENVLLVLCCALESLLACLAAAWPAAANSQNHKPGKSFTGLAMCGPRMLPHSSLSNMKSTELAGSGFNRDAWETP